MQETQGPTDPFLLKKSVLDIFESIFSPVIDIIVEESNLFHCLPLKNM